MLVSQDAGEHAKVPQPGEVQAGRELPIDAIPLFRQVLQDKTPACVPVPAPEPGIPGDNALGATSLLAVPLLCRDRTVGMLVLDETREARPFAPDQIRLATILAGPIALAVEKVCLAKSLGEALDDIETAQEARVRAETLRALGEMASGAAHHLNNRLAVILGRVQLMSMTAQEPDLRRRLEIIERAARSSADVVKRLQSFSRAKPLSSAVAFDVNDLAREAVELTRPLRGDPAHARSRIEVVLTTTSVPSVAGEAAALREVLVNLIVNAVEALPRGGTITIGSWASEESVYCAVHDTGTGMSAEVQRRALEPFFTTKGPRHLGLGLSVGYGVLQGHGGDLEIASAAVGGTTVTLRLPIKPSTGQDPGRPPMATTDAGVPKWDCTRAESRGKLPARGERSGDAN